MDKRTVASAHERIDNMEKQVMTYQAGFPTDITWPTKPE